MEGNRERNIVHDDDVVREDGALVFDPYNPNNKDITAEEVKRLLVQYDLPPRIENIVLWQRAFIHSSYTKRPALSNARENITIVDRPSDCMALRTKSNERLEFVGDGVLECITKYYMYRRFPKADEGFMTEKKIALVKNEHIGKLAYEMGLHKWYIISKHAEEKKTRTNLKKLGCLFESFLGALFLDFNKIKVNDDEGWFEEMFVTGPGFQMAQKFVENVFERHVNWTELIQTDDNYKNILQVMIQKAFKTTPHYIELDRTLESGYSMGVYLCLGQPIHAVAVESALALNTFKTLVAIEEYYETEGKAFVFLGKADHKIKRKAEQMACEDIIGRLRTPGG